MAQRQGYFAAHFLKTPFKNSPVLLPSSSSDFHPLQDMQDVKINLKYLFSNCPVL